MCTSVSLDSTKAFDKLWRSGLFYKLINKIDPTLWRAIYSYYKESKIIVKINNKTSKVYRTTEGCKQGGILSPHLFNFFIDELISICINLNVGAMINEINVSAVGYCDDIILLSPTKGHLDLLLNECNNYAKSWKIEFNALKSGYVEFGKYKNNNSLTKLGDVIIPKVRNMMYLGLPIGESEAKYEYLETRFRKLEKAFYSLHGLGCKPNALSPRIIASIYKQYAQSIFKYGLEVLHLNKTNLSNFNIRQNIIVKRAIGINKYCKTKPLFTVLRIESINELYLKHKIFFYKQIIKNDLTISIFNFLEEHYKNKKSCDDSFVKQIQMVNKSIETENCLLNLKETIRKIENIFVCSNLGLTDTIKFIIIDFEKNRNFDNMKYLLSNFLNYNNYLDQNLNFTVN